MNKYTFRVLSYFVINLCLMALAACDQNPVYRDSAQNLPGRSPALDYNSGEFAIIGVQDAMAEPHNLRT